MNAEQLLQELLKIPVEQRRSLIVYKRLRDTTTGELYDTPANLAKWNVPQISHRQPAFVIG